MPVDILVKCYGLNLHQKFPSKVLEMSVVF